MKNELFKKATEVVDGKRRVASFKDDSGKQQLHLAHVVNLGAVAVYYRYLDFHAPPDAVRRKQGFVVW